MPSPFPGMDPYLEGGLWTTVHTQLGAEIARQLAPRLRPKYLALTAERFVTLMPEGVTVQTVSLYPDVGVARTGRPGPRGGTTAIVDAPLRVATVMPEAIPHVSIEIRDTANRQLVTDIELISPTNKRGDGREEYLTRRRRLLASSAHLMEIDLLRQGPRVPMQVALPAASYFVFLSRAEQRPVTEVWPIQLNESLPVVPVPLLVGDADVPLDLQAALTTIYDAIGYDLAINYRQAPEVRLSSEEEAWVAELLRQAGLRE